jgi:nitrogen fixation NifU-like protein
LVDSLLRRGKVPSELDPFEELEKFVMEDMRKTYSEKAIDHFLNPRNLGELEDADGFGKVTGCRGDTMQICLRVKDGRVTDATFITDGCGTTIACGSMATELAKGKAVTEALKITQDDILNSLDGLPESDIHCSLLAANTLKEALRDYLSLQKEPWKRAYRRVESFWVSQ